MEKVQNIQPNSGSTSIVVSSGSLEDILFSTRVITTGSYFHWPKDKKELLYLYIDMGWPITPNYGIYRNACNCYSKNKCKNPGKHPRVDHGKALATLDKNQIDIWLDDKFIKFSNWATKCGTESRIIAVDIDPRHGGKREAIPFPPTMEYRTGGGGWRLIYEFPEEFKIEGNPKFGEGIELIVNGYIVLPPSDHIQGVYKWINDLPIAKITPEFLELSTPPEISNYVVDNRFELPPKIFEGNRDVLIYKYCCSLRAAGGGMEDFEILQGARTMNDLRCEPPLDDITIQAKVKSACKFPKGHAIKEDNPIEDVEKFTLTDLGNAMRFVKLHIDKAKYCKAQRSWFIWDGELWKEDTIGKINILAEDVIKLINYEAAQTSDKEERKQLSRHAYKTESAYAIRQFLSLAENHLAIDSNDFDRDNHLVNANNGIIDLSKGILLPHDSKYLMSKKLNASFDPGVKCPKWLAFLDFALNKDADTIKWVQKALGLSLSGRSDKVLPFLYGVKDTGKSTFSETLLEIFGSYAQKTNIEAFSIGDLEQGGDKPNSYIKRLKKARFVIANETRNGQKLNVALIKDLTGGDTLPSRGMYDKNPDNFLPTHTIWIYGNHKPAIGGDEEDVWGRVSEIDFTGIITPEMKRPIDEVKAEYLKEASGILNWILEGYKLWATEGLKKSARIEKSTNEYKNEEDIFKQFIDETMEFGNGFRISKDELIAQFNFYCLRNSNKKSTFTPTKVTRRLNDDFHISSGGKAKKYYLGLQKMANSSDLEQNPLE